MPDEKGTIAGAAFRNARKGYTLRSWQRLNGFSARSWTRWENYGAPPREAYRAIGKLIVAGQSTRAQHIIIACHQQEGHGDGGGDA